MTRLLPLLAASALLLMLPKAAEAENVACYDWECNPLTVAPYDVDFFSMECEIVVTWQVGPPQPDPSHLLGVAAADRRLRVSRDLRKKPCGGTVRPSDRPSPGIEPLQDLTL